MGDRIECNIGEWAKGTVIKAWYREDEWPEGKWAAYQVKLDMGQFIYAPIDQDKVCRAPVDDDGGPPAECEPMEPEAPKDPMTWEEIKQWDSCVYIPKPRSSLRCAQPFQPRPLLHEHLRGLPADTPCCSAQRAG